MRIFGIDRWAGIWWDIIDWVVGVGGLAGGGSLIAKYSGPRSRAPILALAAAPLLIVASFYFRPVLQPTQVKQERLSKLAYQGAIFRKWSEVWGEAASQSSALKWSPPEAKPRILGRIREMQTQLDRLGRELDRETLNELYPGLGSTFYESAVPLNQAVVSVFEGNRPSQDQAGDLRSLEQRWREWFNQHRPELQDSIDSAISRAKRVPK